MLRVALSAALVAGALLASAPAGANGKFPAADQLVVNPTDPSQIAMMSTFGVLSTVDGGVGWDIICEGGVGYEDYEPAIAVNPTGTLLLALNEGVGVGRDGACDWALAEGLSEPVVDISRSIPEPGTAVAISTFAANSAYWASTDDGASFQLVSTLPPGFAALTVDIAPSDAMRVYISGVDVNAGNTGAMAVSDDAGASWTTYPIPGTDMEQPFIGAMDPTNPERLYVRLTGPGVLLVTDDGGQTYSEIFTSPTNKLLGLAVSPDGGTVLVGTEFDGVHRADSSSFAFEKISEVAVRCLTWTDDALYACVNEFLNNDGFIVGRSQDAGETYDPLVNLACIRGVLECPAETTVGAVCPAVEPQLAAQLKSDTCGEGGGGTGGGDAAPGGGAGVGGAGGSGAGGSDADGGCGCRLIAPGDRDEPAWFALALAGLWLSRRRSI